MLDKICVNYDSNDHIQKYKIKPHTILNEPFHLHQICCTFYQNINDINNYFPSLTIPSFTISQCTINFANIIFKCKFNINASSITAENCLFYPYNNDYESAIEIFANSKSIFRNCTFYNAARAAVSIQNSNAQFINCRFCENDTSILIVGNSEANISLCQFQNSTVPQLLLSQGRNAIISIEDSSKIEIDKCNFSSTCIYLTTKSRASVSECNQTNCKDFGIFFKDSTGSVVNCHFDGFKLSPIACLGTNNNPEISNLTFTNCSSNAIFSSDYSTPEFSELRFVDINSGCFSNLNNDNSNNNYSNHSIDSNIQESREADISNNTDNFDIKILTRYDSLFKRWFAKYKKKRELLTNEPEDPLKCFQIELNSFLTGILNNFNQDDEILQNLARLVYLFSHKESLKGHKECEISEIKEYFCNENLDKCTSESKQKMKELIDRFKANINDADFDSVYCFHANVLNIYIFKSLFDREMNTTESCSTDDDNDFYWISYYIQIDNMKNTYDQISEELEMND